jgi:poly(hydroxyalkanoate) depolymerase family esterase
MRSLLLLLCGCSLGGAPGGSKPQGDDAPPTGGDDEPPTSTGDGGTTPAQGITCSDATGVSGIAKVIECSPTGMEGKTGTPAALVVALHGYTQTADEYRLTTQWDHLAAKYKFYVVFPQTNADVVNAGGRPAAWKWWKDFGDFTRTSFNQHYKPIQDVVTRMKAAHDIDPDRVFITGLSAGGYMTSLMLACFPDVFAAGAVFSGGPTDCDLKCTDSNKQQDWTRPAGYHVPNATDLKASYPAWWNDASKRKPRVIAFHGGLDQAVKPVNLDDVMRQWTGALGLDTTPDNAALGLPTTIGGYAYKAYGSNGKAAVATVLMPELGHGSPVKPGTGATDGGTDPYPSQVAADCSNVSDPTCKQDWTNTSAVYGAYHAAVFFGLAP